MFLLECRKGDKEDYIHELLDRLDGKGCIKLSHSPMLMAIIFQIARVVRQRIVDPQVVPVPHPTLQ